MRASLFYLGIAACGFFGGRVAFPPAVMGGKGVLPPPAAPTQPLAEKAEPPQVAAGLPVEKQMSAVLEGKDAFAAARRSAEWIAGLTLEDFRALAKDPKRFRPPYFSDGFNQEFSDAYFRALAARWLEVDPDAVAEMKRVNAEIKKADQHTNDDLLDAAAKEKPERVIAARVKDEKKPGLEQYEWTALRALGKADIRRAREVLAGLELKGADVQKNAEQRMLSGLAEVDPLSALALGKQSGLDTSYYALEAAKRIGAGMVQQVVEAAEGKLNHALPGLMLRYPDLAEKLGEIKVGGLNEELLKDAERTLPEERARLLADYEKLPTGGRDVLCAALVDAWSREDPAAAAKWALAHSDVAKGESMANLAAERVFLRWVNNDLDAAMAWWKNLPPSPLRDRVGAQASTYAAEAGRMEDAMLLCPPSMAKDQSITQQLTQFLVERDPAMAAEWLAGVPSESLGQDTMGILMTSWLKRDPAAVGAWLNGLPAGGVRDAAVRGFVVKQAAVNPQIAAEWVATVGDPKVRKDATGWVFYPWNRDDPKAAREWLKNLPAVDERWKARLLK